MVLKKYTNILLMINTNKNIKKGRANDILCRDISIKLKKKEEFNQKGCDGRKVLAVSITNVDYMLYEHWKYRNSVTSGGKVKVYP